MDIFFFMKNNVVNLSLYHQTKSQRFPFPTPTVVFSILCKKHQQQQANLLRYLLIDSIESNEN